MKALQIKLTLLLLLFTGMVNAQIVNIPDANFKYCLLNGECPPGVSGIVDISDLNDNSVYNVDTSGDGEIQVSEALQIKKLRIEGNESSVITSLIGISSFTNLEYINFSFNFLPNAIIDFTSLVNLKEINASNTYISSLEVHDLVHLEKINGFATYINSINLSNLPSLNWLWLELGTFESLDISDSPNLTTLYLFSNNNLSSLNLTGLTQLTTFFCVNNNFSNINLSGLESLTFFDCSYNNLTTLDISDLNLLELNCSNNNLSNLNLKNGNYETYLNFSGNPNLQYICADDSQITDVQTKINIYGYSNTCSVSSYCSFTPGGNYNTITGNVKFDIDNNSCDANDLAKPNIRVNINDGANTGASFTSDTGNYSFFTQSGSFIVSPEIENPTWFTFSPTIATIPFANNNNNLATQDFCIAANGVHPDLEVVLAPIAPARPGFDATYKLVYKNKGNQTLSGSVNLVFDDAKTDFVSANPIVDNLAVNSLTWNYNTLLPFENRSIDVVLNVNSPLETPAVNIGDVLNFSATINPISGDELPADNTFAYNQTVVGSFDPNDITCLEGNSVAPSEIGEYLHYVINFENTGNYPAENVVVKTIVDTTKFDINSLQLLNTSNPVDARITGNVVEFIFENIQLGGPGGHGHILLKIKSKNTLVAGDAVAKSAGIYFDYNAPVDTGMVTTVFQSLSNTIFEKDDSINVSPNPTNGTININCNNNVKKMELYDVQGRVLETQIGETKTLDISEKANGIYFLKITTEKGSKVEKVIKE
jgi:uncharacterized repeat protein (TIGR01451 family)